jgi:hypothetical protein
MAADEEKCKGRRPFQNAVSEQLSMHVFVFICGHLVRQ